VLFFCRVLNRLYVFSVFPFLCLFAAIDHQSRVWAIGSLQLAFSFSPHIFPWPVFDVSSRLRICASLEGSPLQLTLLHRSAGIKRSSIRQR
jgi:hypothetical protein